VSIAILAAAKIGDSYTDSAAAVVAVFAQAPGITVAQPETPFAAVAEAGDSHTHSATPVFAVFAQAAGAAVPETGAALAAAAEAGDSYTDSAAAVVAVFAQAAGPAGVPVMMVPGTINANSNWVEASSLARAIENAMVGAGVLNLGKESKATTKDRRKGFVAIANGLVNYLQQNMDIQINRAQLHDATNVSLEVPTADTTLTQAVK